VDRWVVLGPVILVIVTLACYWTPMTSNRTSILWDAADTFQPMQNYLSQELHGGRIPFWTPFPWAGYPFLADPQVGAWYPLNWPFLLIGVSPHVLVAEHWLHSLLACFGAYFLAFRLLRHRPAAVIAGLCYGLSGFYVGHSSHTVIMQCAAWMPWLLLLLDCAIDSEPIRYAALGGIFSGLMILAGHFQTILYSFAALGLFATAKLIAQPKRWPRILVVAAAMPVIGTLISAVATGPGLELAANSVRASLAALTHTEGLIPLQSLATLVYPDFYGVLSEHYTGPSDITQFYFYAGILLVPLAILGLWRSSVRWTGLLLVIPTIWYAMGSSAGLYLLVARLPGFSSVRAPVNIWFVPALGLALLAAAGAVRVAEKWTVRWIAPAILLLFAVDLFVSNSAKSPLAYGRVPYEEAYGSKEDTFRRIVANALPPLTRFDAPENLPIFGPLSHYLDTRTETTYGYGPLKLARYDTYVTAMRSNLSLRNGLGVSIWFDQRDGSIHRNPLALPRVTVPKEVVPVRSPEESLDKLKTLDPLRQALVPAAIAPTSQDPNGTAQVTDAAPGHYRIHYKCASASLLRVSDAFFPGWTAAMGGRTLEVVPVDYALFGMVAPAGEGDIELDYRSRYLGAGMAVSLLALLGCAAALFMTRSNTRQSPTDSKGR
jgi:hypothetical protein